MRSDREESIPFLEASESLVETNSETDPNKRHALAPSITKPRPTKSVIRRLLRRQFLVALVVVYLSIAMLAAAPFALPRALSTTTITPETSTSINPENLDNPGASIATAAYLRSSQGGSASQASSSVSRDSTLSTISSTIFQTGSGIVSVLVHSTTTTISCIPSTIAVNQPSTCTAYVTDASTGPTTPSGIVLVSLNITSSATGSISGGGCGLSGISSSTSFCSISFTPSGSGTAFVTALYGGDAAHSPSQGEFTASVPVHHTTMTISCVPSSVVVSQASTCTATVADLSANPTTPSGDVLFSLNSTSTATGTTGICGLGGINSADSMCSVNFTPSGSGTGVIDAFYGGDTAHSVSTAQSTVTVSGTAGSPVDSTTTAVACSPSSTAVSQPSTCTVTVVDTLASPTTPSGTVLFGLNNTGSATGGFGPLGCGLGAVNPSTSSCSVNFNPTGSGTGYVIAIYGGDATHSPSFGQSSVTVLVHSTTTSVVCSPSSVAVNQASTCTVSVTDNALSPVTPTGPVLFSLDPTSAATGNFNGGSNACGLGRVNVATSSCSVNFNPTGAGLGVVDATYDGDTVHSVSSGQSSLTVMVHSTATVVVCSPATVAVGQTSTCTVSVTDSSPAPVTPTGPVLFSLDGSSATSGLFNGGSNACGLGAVNPSTSSCSVNFVPSGSGAGVIVATYDGDTVHIESSGRFTVNVPVHPTRSSVSCTPVSIPVGQPSTCTVFVRDTTSSPATPSGIVLFSLNGTSTARGSFNGGGNVCGLTAINSTSSDCAIPFIASGSGTGVVDTSYGGDPAHAISSARITLSVPVHSTTTSLDCSPSPIAVSQTSTCTVFVRDNSPAPISPPSIVLLSLNSTSTATGSFGPSVCGLAAVNSTTSSCAVNFGASGSGTALVDVSYGGDPAHSVSSGKFTLPVSGSLGSPVHPTDTTVSCLPSSLVLSQVSTCTVSVTDLSTGPTAPSGYVLFSLNSTSTATGSMSSGYCGLGGINTAESICSVNFTPSGIGAAYVSVIYGGDVSHQPSMNQATVSVLIHNTIASVSCIPTFMALSQASTCTVVVTDTSAAPATPTGYVLFSLNGTSTATGSISSGYCGLGAVNSATSTCSVSFTPSGAGVAFVTALYGGDAAHSLGQSRFIASIPLHSTATNVSCVPSTIAVGQVSTCTVVVTDTSTGPTGPVGIVLFILNGTSTATGSISGGGCGLSVVNSATSTCSVSYTANGHGTAFVTAIYGGDAGHSGSSSFTVNPQLHSTITSVSCSPSSTAVDGPSNCIVSVTDNSAAPTIPSGTVLLSLAGTSNSSGSFSSGGSCGLGRLNSATTICSFIFTPSSSGTAVISADYLGDSVHNPSSSSFTITVSGTLPASGTISVPAHSTTISVSCVPSSVIVSQVSTCTASVTDLSSGPTTPSGDVLFGLNSTSSATGSLGACGLGGVNSANSICSVNFTPSGSGTAFVTAVYGGDVAHNPSLGESTVTVSGATGVAAHPTMTSVACSPASTAVSQPSTCTVTVVDTLASPTTPSGTVIYALNNTSTASGSFSPIACGLGAVNPSTSSCSVSFNPTGSGIGVVIAVYGGDAAHSPSGGQSSVSVLVHSTTTSVVCSPATISVSQPSTCTVSVTDNSPTPITPTGPVLFSLNSTSTASGNFNGASDACGLGRVNVATSSCSVTFNPAGSGIGVIVATYGGDTVHSVSSSSTSVSVLVHSTTTTVVCSPASAAVGQTSTCTVSVTDNSLTPVTPTGPVLFSLNSTSTASGNFNGGSNACGLGTVNPSTSSCSVTFTPSGSGLGAVVGTYDGDTIHSVSSGRFTVSVPVHTSRTTVSCTPASIAVGQSSGCTVVVRDISSAPVTPSGIVLFGLNSTSTAAGSFNGNACGLVGINGTSSDCAVTFTASGSGTGVVDASYGGDPAHGTSLGLFAVSVPVHLTVTSVSCSPSSVTVGQVSSCTVFVKDTSSSPTTPSGAVLFSLNGTSTAVGSFGPNACGLGGVNTTTSTCAASFTASGSGNGLVDASYGGDAPHSVSSVQFTVSVAGSLGAPVHPTAIQVSCVPSSIGVSQVSVCTAYVTDASSGPATPSGTVLFSFNSTSTATGSFSGSTCGLSTINSAESFCSVSFTASGAGTGFVTAFYGGDAAHSPSIGRSIISVLIHSTTTIASTVIASVTVGTNPWGVAYDSSNGYIYATNINANMVSVISGTRVVATISVGTNPAGLAYDSGNGYLYVANRDSVSVINATTNVVVATIPVPVVGLVEVAYDSRNGYVYVTNANALGVMVIDGTTVLNPVSVGHGTDGIAYDNGNGFIYAATGQGNSVSVINGTVVIATIPVQQEAFGVAYDSGNGFVYVTNANSNSVSVISGTSVVATTQVGSIPYFVAYNSGNGYIYVTNSGSNTTSVINGTTVVAIIHVGNTPFGVAYDSGNGDVYVANSGSNTLSVISTTTLALTCVPTAMAVGQASTCTVSVTDLSASPTTPTGTVMFSLNDASTATGSISDGGCGLSGVNSAESICSVSFTPSGAGTASVTALYGGDAAHSPSLGQLILSIPVHTTTTIVSCVPSTIAVNQASSCTVYVTDTSASPTTPSGVVLVGLNDTSTATGTISNGGCGVGPINSATASCSITFTAYGAGTAFVTALYGGDRAHSLSHGQFIVSVPIHSTTTSISCVPSSVAVDQAAICSAYVTDTSVSPTTPSGVVLVGLSNTSTATGTVSNGGCGVGPINSATSSCSVTFTASGSGTACLVALYGGDAAHSGSSSFCLALPTDFTFSTSPVTAAVLAGQTATSTVTVTSVNGFTDTVNLSVSISPSTGLTCTLSSPSISLSSTTTTGSSTLSCSGSALFGGLGPSAYTVTVTGTGAASGKTHSATFTVTVEDFGLSASPTTVSPTVGVAGTSTITVGPLPVTGIRFSGTVSFSVATNSTSLSCTAPASVTGGGPTTLSCTGSVAGNYNATVTGASSNLSHSVSVIYHVIATDFIISASPATAAVLAGQAATSTVTVTGQNGFTDTVNLATSISPSTGLTCTLLPASVSLSSSTTSATSTLSCTGSALFGGLGPSAYTVTVTGNGVSSGKSHSTTFTVTVEDFGLSASPASVSPTVGVAGTSTITVGPLPVTGIRFSGTVSFTVATNSTNLSCTNPASVSGGGPTTLSCTGSAAGNYNATVTGTSSTLSHSVSIIYHVLPTDFTIFVNPTSATVLAGQPATTSVNVTGLNGFADTVNLSTSVGCGFGCTPNLTCTLSPMSVTLSSTTKTATSTLSCSGSAIPPIGGPSYTVTVTGTGATSDKTHSTTFTVTVQDFGLSASPTSVSPTVGVAGTSTISLTSFEGGFSRTVMLTVTTNSTNLSCTLNPTSIGFPGSSTLSCTGSAAGNFNATVTGTSSNLSHSVSVIYHVLATDFTISASPATAIVLAGQAAMSTVTVTGENGFTDTVNLVTSIAPSTGLSCRLSPTSVSLSSSTTSGSSTLSCTGSALFGGLGPSSYAVTITGTGASSGKTHTTSFTVTVEDFTISASPTSISPVVGVVGTSSITLGSLPVTGTRFSATVSLAVTTNSTNLSCTVAPTSDNFPFSPATLSCTGSAVGNYNATVTGTSSNLSHSASVVYHVLTGIHTTTTSVSCSPSSVTVGQSSTCTVTVTDVSSSGATSPSGTVTFSTSGSGSFVPATGTCSLTADGANIAACAVVYTPTAVGSGSHSISATYSGDSTHSSSSTSAAFVLAVARASPTISSTVTPTSMTIGGSASDLAALTGGFNSTGIVTYAVYSDSACTNPVFTSASIPLGTHSAMFTPSTAGTYLWIAQYNGDANNNAVATICGATNETLTVGKATIGVTTALSPSTITIGSSATDLATVTGGFSPSGTVTYTAYSDAACTAQAFTSTNVPLGTVSAAFTPSTAGTYYFVAKYNGDANNNAVATTCGASVETLTVNKASGPLLTLLSSNSITVGNSVSDSATLAGSFQPGGTVTYSIFTNNICAAPGKIVSTVAVTAGVIPDSRQVTFNSTGNFGFQASYSGDANNNPVTSSCEPLTVSTNVSILTALSSTTIIVGGSVTDSAILAGQSATASGSVTYSDFADDTCTGPITTVSVVNVVNGIIPSSRAVIFNGTGSFSFEAVYSGDVNDNSAISSCESLTIEKATPQVTSTVTPSSITVSSSATDLAAVSGFNPTGTITYTAYSDSSCTTSVFTSSSITLGTASGAFTPTATGTYYWIASYSGDSNNNSAATTCGAAGETLTVNAAFDYSISVSPISASIIAGSSTSATVTAILTGGTAQPVALQLLISPNPAVCQVTSGTSPCGTVSFSPTSITPSSNGATSTLTISTTSMVPPGIYTLTITGSPAGSSHGSATFTLTIAAPSVSTVGCGHDLSCTVQSNATLTRVKFAGVTFHAEADGPKGAHGYANITIPKTAIPNIDNLHVFVDNNKLSNSDVTITSNSTDYFIYFTFTFHSPVLIDIQFTAPQNATNLTLGLDPTLFYMILAVVVAVVVVVSAFAVVRRRGRNRLTR